ncbi:hypothetical protein [Nevskia soli]|uniref:hypothetical protein n=1 Tax=Nevskia soli TaxID=418856 RepID=UPI0004A784AA|nr:hypothetical protein [Nevskia soli]
MQGSLRYRLAFLLAAGGMGLCGYAGLQWYELPHYSEDDIKASTELNLQVDLARQGDKTPPPADQLEKLRQGERAEIETDIRSQHERVMSWLAGGLALLVMAGGQGLAIYLGKIR